MTRKRARSSISLSRNWRKTVRSGVLHAISLASTAMTAAWSRASERGARARHQAEIDRLRAEVGHLEEEMAIKDARWKRHSPRKRPHYGPIDRMRILQLRASRGWTIAQVAERFLVTEDTIQNWMRRVDEEGESALVRLEEPVNKYPDFVAYLVKRLKVLCPTLGKVRIANVLARAGLHLSATTVGRMLKREESPVADEVETVTPGRRVRAKKPNQVWHVDLTVVPTGGGLWTPWFPFTRVQCWPFCWWVAVVVDHASRRFVGFAVFKKRPTSREVCSFLGRVIRAVGAQPKHIISDKGKEFWCKQYKGWCRRRKIRPRYGAIGKHGSITIVERFIRSMKTECTRQIVVPFRLDRMRKELVRYAIWYDEHRPHMALGGRTPIEVSTV